MWTLCYFLYCILWLSVAGARGRFFQSSSLVWLEQRDDDTDHTRVQTVDIYTDTRSKQNTDQPSTMAMTETGFSPYTCVDVDYENRTLVAVAKSKKKIMAISFDQDGFQIHWQLFEGTSNKVNGIAVDWTTDVVYWTDAAYNAIFAVSMAMPNIAQAIIEDLDEPYSIATHPMKGFLFWTDVGDHPKIMRASQGGRKHRVVIEFVDQSVPTAITVDYAENRLYWLFDNKAQDHQGLGSSDLYGNNPKLTKLAEGGSYFDLDVFRGSVYLTNQDYREVHVIPRHASRPVTRLTLPGTPYGIAVLDRERQQDRSNVCMYSSCPGVCTRSNSSQDCFCNARLKTQSDPQTIKRYCGHDAFSGILIPKADGIYTMVQNFAEFTPPTSIKPQQVMASQHPVRALTSDTRLMKIFYYESVTKIIKSTRLQQGSKSTTVSYAVGDIGGIAIDGPSENLYWTDQEYGHIMVAKTDGSFAYKLLRNLGKPKAIAIHPKKMFLYWSNIEDYAMNRLQRCYVDGRNCQTIVQDYKYYIVDVTIDFNTDRLYWVHRAVESALYTSDLNGDGIEELYSRRNSLLTGVAVMYDYVIVSDASYQSGGLHSIDKRSKKLVGNATYGWFRYGNWFGVDFHHRSNEPKHRSSACDMRRNPCEQLCVPSNSTQRYSCFCSIGYRINSTDHTKCEFGSTTESRYEPYVLLADQRYQKLMYISFLSQFVVIPVQQLQQPYAVTFDMTKRQVYWSDLDTGTISRADLDGSNQEIIIANPDEYFVSLDIDPGNRLLYYIVLKRQELEPGVSELCGSLVAYDIDKNKSILLIDGALGKPASLALNIEYGYVFLIDQGCVWRIDMNGSNMKPITDFTMEATLIATKGEYIYFTNEIRYGDIYKPKTTQIWRSGLDGENRTLLLELEHGDITSLKVYGDRDGDLLYWTNTSSRAVHRYSLSRPRGIETRGSSQELFLPTDIFVNFVQSVEEPACSKMSGFCDGICLPSPFGPSCVATNRTGTMHIEDSNKTREFCRIPAIHHGEVKGQKESLLVPHGFRASVQCFALHRISSMFPMRCFKGEWSHIPKCDLVYNVCGDEFRGYKAYTESGQFFVYPTATKVDVICIGGGGGGYDATNNAKTAGDGGDSRFSSYLVAYGGKGGNLQKGGAGGAGHYRGGDGSASSNCTTGGTAGEDVSSTTLGIPGISHNLFCGAGGYSDDCEGSRVSSETRQFAGPGGTDGNRSIAGLYGGGAGSRTGGTGGGGGYSRLSFTLSPQEIVDIEVGNAGNPSYGQAGRGMVVVTWGDFKIDEYVEDVDVVKQCVLSSEKLNEERTDSARLFNNNKRTFN